MATDPALEILARHDTRHEHHAFGIENLVQQPMVTLKGSISPIRGLRHR